VRRWNQLNRSVETTVMSHTFVVAALALVTACIEASDPKKNLPKDFTYRSILRALFHDLPETFTGDIVTPSKRRIEKFANVAWPKIEQERLKPLTKGIPEILDKDISQLGLLDALPDADTDKDEVGKLVKDCDRLSLLLECVFERSAGRINEEMQTAFDTFAMNLLNSSWRSIREITLHRLHPTGKK